MLNANPIVTQIAANPSLLARLDAASNASELQQTLRDAGITLSGQLQTPRRPRPARSAVSGMGLEDVTSLAAVGMIICPSE
jgi:hypothetical protein